MQNTKKKKKKRAKEKDFSLEANTIILVRVILKKTVSELRELNILGLWKSVDFLTFVLQ